MVHQILLIGERELEDDRVKGASEAASEVASELVNLIALIDDCYLRGIESLYTWKTLVPERLRSGSYSDVSCSDTS